MPAAPALGALLTCSLILVSAAEANASPASRQRTHEGFVLAYDLQFKASYDVLAEAVAMDPLDPAPRRAIAAVTWIEILFAQGVATFEAFTGEVSREDLNRPATPQELTSRFTGAIEDARSLAQRQLAHADEWDSHYQIGATAGLSALYQATVEGRTLGAFGQGRRAVGAMERARQRDRGRREPGLILGISQYTISTMSWPVRSLAHLSGLSGDRETGLALLREAALPGTETETDALLVLMIIDNREGRHDEALQRLASLQRAHPRNRLLWLNRGATALAARRPYEAEQALSQGIVDRHWTVAPPVLGEVAMWFAHRGTARACLHQMSEAEADLQRGLASDPRDWVRGRIHGQLGELALAEGARERARREFETALTFSERGGDRPAVKDVKMRLSELRP